MVPVLRAMARAVVAAPWMDTAPPRWYVAVDVPFLQPHLDAPAASRARLRVLSAGYSSTLGGGAPAAAWAAGSR